MQMQMPRFKVPEALVTEILSKLPVKSLIRFNCVSEKGENFLVKQSIRFPFFIHDSPCVWGARRGLFCLHSALMDDTKFDFKTDDYKFIRFVTLCYVDSEYGIESRDDVSQVELYSLKCDSWKEIASPNYSPLDYCLSNNCLDGICYWIIATGNSPYEKVMILSFDMANEKFSVSPILEFVRFFSKTNINVLVFVRNIEVVKERQLVVSQLMSS
ncbi:hypothetical protein Gotur_034778 [Gossypium turneri]